MLAWILGALVFPVPVEGQRKPATRPAAYPSVTEAQAKAAVDRARERARLAESALNVSLVEVQTDHFLIFTDWPAGDHAFLRRNLEAANTAVSRQFGVAPRENVFVGRLPVYMFAGKEDFLKFAMQIDEAGIPESALGYYTASSDGLGHMAMWQPDVAAEGGNLKAAQVKWARTLTHEFTHAFVHRYRGTRAIPRWLNEGIAEVIAHAQFPPEAGNRRTLTRLFAAEGRDLSNLFDDEVMPGGEYYPVLQSMTQMLIARDRRRFVAMIDAIKGGAPAEEALRANFGLDYAALVTDWRRYAMSER